jgi:carboxyl-terminal processing protease
MRMKLLWFFFVLATTAQAETFDVGTSLPNELKPEQQQSQAASLATQLLTRYHYKAMPLDEVMSEKIFDQYLKSLDPEKLFFVQGDIDGLSGFRKTLGDSILKEDLSAPFAIFNRLAQRANERFTYARALLKEGFDFRQKESYQYERDKVPWLKSETEMHELWHKRVKNDWLRLKLAGQDDKSIVETLDKRYEHELKRIGQAKSEDAFQIFMNAYTMTIDPHTNYMGVRAAEEFDTSMSLSLIGIGGTLEEKDGYTVIRELVPGGPAALSGQLNAGDRILGVAQGTRGVMTNIQGWRLVESITLIRGALNTVLRLDVLPAEAGPDGQHKVVSLIRKKIAMEDQAAKKTVLSVEDGETVRHIGVISLPSFYEDFDGRQKGDPAFRSATRDVSRLLTELRQEKVDGVVIDLRNDGGGSLSEAIDLTGLFVGKGPVVQERDAHGDVTVEKSTETNQIWDGPLAVLINRGSASASEIFAAAIQDYGRGLVIGERSFGKGTVQAMINLDQLAKNDNPQYGELKMTVAQFFRVNGGTTQLRGVKPDILFPSVAVADNLGESSFDNALPWMQIKAADYAPVGNLNYLLPILLTRHETRVKKDKDFQFLEEDLADLDLQRKKNEISLNESERRKEREAQEARLTSHETAREAGKSIAENIVDKESQRLAKIARQDDGLQANERNLASELADEKAQKEVKDIFLNEAIHILSDEVDLLSTRQAAHLTPELSVIHHRKQAVNAAPGGVS